MLTGIADRANSEFGYTVVGRHYLIEEEGMKQRQERPLFVFPKKKPKTILGLYKWHRKLLEDCVFHEFEKRALEAGISKINEEILKYVHWSNDETLKDSALLTLKHLNRLKAKWEEERAVAKQVVRVLHDTNEMIIVNLLKAHTDGETVRHLQTDSVQRSANLLHEPGWLFELSCAEELEKDGRVGFLTFGTVFDAKGFDVIGFSRPRRRVKFNMYPRERRASKK
jgi:hypothetical protein